MGEIIKLTCKDCASNVEIKVGSGRMHHKMKYILPYFDILQQEEISSFSFTLKEGYCDKCSSIIAVPIFVWNNQVRYGICSTCRENLSEKAIEAIFCPKCEGKEFIRQRIGFWD